MAANNESTCIGSTYTMSTLIRCIDIESTCIKSICVRSAFVKGVKPRALIRLKILNISMFRGKQLLSLIIYKIDFCFNGWRELLKQIKVPEFKK